MRIPALKGLIRRRLLVNFRVDPAVMQARLPRPFEPKLHEGHAIAGICLIRLEAIRPFHLPARFGVSSENAAHRVAVTWRDDRGGSREGVFVPRRDTGSLLNRLAGGRLFPGEHHAARFTIEESETAIALRMRSADGQISVRVRGRIGGEWPASSCFSSLSDASRFFEPGAVGYSVTRGRERLDGLELRTEDWRVEPLLIEEVHSSYFSDPDRFPPGFVEFDCALLMRDIAHEWHAAEELYA